MKYLGRFESGSQHFHKASEQLEKFGVTYFSYGLISKDSIVNTVFSNQEWGLHYKANHYENSDPLFQGVMKSNLSLIMWGALHPHGEEQKVMSERNEFCGIKSGLTIGIKKNNESEIIALGAAISNHEFYSLLNDDHQFGKIQNILKNFYVTHKKLLKAS